MANAPLRPVSYFGQQSGNYHSSTFFSFCFCRLAATADAAGEKRGKKDKKVFLRETRPQHTRIPINNSLAVLTFLIVREETSHFFGGLELQKKLSSHLCRRRLSLISSYKEISLSKLSTSQKGMVSFFVGLLFIKRTSF